MPSATTNQPYSSVRIGGDPDLIQTLCQALSHHFPSIKTKNSHYIYDIQNKYFQAKVHVSPFSIQDHVNIIQDDSLSTEDGIILLFDHTHSNVISTFVTPMHQCAESNETCGDVLRLCISVLPSATTSSIPSDTKVEEQIYSERVLWCLDHGYEYIEKIDISSQGIKEGFDKREKEGFARVVEAIQSTIWSTARQHQRNQTTVVKNKRADAKIDTEEDEPNSKEQDQDFHQTKRTSIEKLNVSNEAVGTNKEKEILNTLSQSSSQEQNDTQYHQLDSILQQVNQIRRATKENSGTISDDERRARAADMAMKLLEVLDLSDDDDDDNDDNK